MRVNSFHANGCTAAIVLDNGDDARDSGGKHREQMHNVL